VVLPVADLRLTDKVGLRVADLLPVAGKADLLAGHRPVVVPPEMADLLLASIPPR
jgi:hypothetical protein